MHRRATGEARAQLDDRRPLCNIADFAQKVIGQRHADEGSSRLQLAMQVVRNVAQLDHHWHVPSIQACVEHIKADQSTCR
jgi:hypothetical protein